MNTLIKNDITIFEPTEQVLQWAETNLVLNNPEYQTMKFLGKDNVIKWKHIPEKLNLFAIKRGALILPFGLLRAVWDMIKDYPYRFEFNNAGDISVKNDEPTFSLYDYQEEAVAEMVKRKGGILTAQCGGGKTICGIEIIRRIGKKALWLCGTGDLLRQAKKDMLEQYPNMKIGLTTEGKLDIGEDVTISTVQTLINIDPDLYKNEFDVIICDEAAHVAATPTKMKMFATVISNIPARYKYGLTATPSRSDGLIKAMYAYIGTDSKGWFSPMFKATGGKTIRSIHQRVDLDNGYEDKLYMFCDTAGMIDYNALISCLSDDTERTEQIINNIVKCSTEGRKQVVLTLRVEHCEQILEMLKKKGINAVLCVGKVSAKQRNDILNQNIKWDVIVATYALLKEGVSIKELDTLHMVTPIKDKGTVVQCAGRIERFLENKKQPIVYDYVDIDIPYCEKAFTMRRRALKSRF